MNSKILYALFMGINGGLAMMNIPPVIDRLMDVYSVSYTSISILISILFWSHACLQLPGGLVTDQIGLKKAIFASLSCILLGSLLPVLFPRLGLAILGRIIIGIGTGLSFVSTMKLVAVYAPEGKAGVYQSFFGGSFSVGSIIPFLILPYLVRFEWRLIFLIPVGTSFILILVLWGMDISPPGPESQKPMPLGQILHIKEGWILGFYHALSFGSLMALGNWIPSLLAEVWQGSTAMKLAWGGALVMMISGVARITGGFVLLRLKPLKVANGSIAILFILFLALFLIPVPWLVLTLALLAACFSSFNFGAFFHMASQIIQAHSLASLMGFINTIALFGTVLFTFMFGWIKDTFGSFTFSFAVLSFLCLIAFLIGHGPLRRKFAST